MVFETILFCACCVLYLLGFTLMQFFYIPAAPINCVDSLPFLQQFSTKENPETKILEFSD